MKEEQTVSFTMRQFFPQELDALFQYNGFRIEAKYGDFDEYKKKALNDFKSYPVLNREAGKLERFEEVFKTLYDKEMIEKEILYYNFIEREVIKTGNNKDFKNEKGKLISPRPKQKFGTDKIIRKIDEFLDHESDDDYFINKLAAELDKKGITCVATDAHRLVKYKRTGNNRFWK